MKTQNTRSKYGCYTYDYNVDDEIPDDYSDDEDVTDEENECEEEFCDENDCVIDLDNIEIDEADTEGFETDPEKIKTMFDTFNQSTGYKRELAGNEIVNQLKKLIYSIGHKYFSSYMKNLSQPQTVEDLTQSAWCGVFEAISAYDPTRGNPTTYFYRPILHEMTEYINRYYNKATSYSVGVRKKINQARESLAAVGNDNPSILDLAYESGLRPSKIRKSLDIEVGAKTISLDAPVDDTTDQAYGMNHVAVANDSYANPYEIMCKKERIAQIRAAIDALPKSQREVIVRRFGLAGNRPENYTSIFKATGITTNRTKELEQRAMTRLRLNPTLRQSWAGGKAMEIKEELDFEPVAMTPDSAAWAMADLLQEIEDVSLFD